MLENGYVLLQNVPKHPIYFTKCLLRDSLYLQGRQQTTQFFATLNLNGLSELN